MCAAAPTLTHLNRTHVQHVHILPSILCVRAYLPLACPYFAAVVARFLPPKHWQSFRRALSLSREAMATPRLSHDRFMDSSAVWPPHSKAKAARCRRICCLTCSPVAQVNTHLQTFMSRNAPQPEEVIQPHILEAAERSRDESVTTISYPKDLRGSVLMCAAQLQHPPARTARRFSFACALNAVSPLPETGRTTSCGCHTAHPTSPDQTFSKRGAIHRTAALPAM